MSGVPTTALARRSLLGAGQMPPQRALFPQLFREFGELRVEFRKLFGDVVEGFLQLSVG
jgi:hypothetical protein